MNGVCIYILGNGKTKGGRIDNSNTYVRSDDGKVTWVLFRRGYREEERYFIISRSLRYLPIHPSMRPPTRPLIA